MESSIVKFAERLRRSGIQASPAEVLDAVRALTVIPMEDRTTFKDTLRTTLVKNRRDIVSFDMLFDLFFCNNQLSTDNKDDKVNEDADGLEDIINELLQIHQPDLSLMSELIMTGRFGPLTRMILSRSRGMGMERMESPLQLNFFMRNFRNELDVEQARSESNRFLDDMLAAGLEPEMVEAMREVVERNFARLDDQIKGVVKRELEQNRYQFIQKMVDEDISTSSLAGLTEEDLRAMRPAVERLARRLKDRLSLRLRKAERGRIDLKGTLRRNIGLGGPLPYLEFRRKKPDRPQIVALCDVSNSVRNFSRFMLLFLYTLKEVVSRVRSFIFVGDLVEVTKLFKEKEINDAVSAAAMGRGLRYAFRTDYGSAFTQFYEEFLSSVTSKTTVFILGDGRNNYYDPHTEAIESISKQARKLIWLNPEPRLNWRLGDSAAEVYRPYCTTMAECGNLSQLSRLIEENLMP